MSGVEDQGLRPEGVDSAGDVPTSEGVSDLIAARDADDPDQVTDVPAGGAGADSGGSDAVRVDPDSRSSVKDESIHNDEPGVGTRRSE
nr:hypothetical protein [uncultured Microbacterium sp.]